MADLHSRLEPFLLLARSTRGAAAAKVIVDATAANGVYVFSELMELPNIKELANDPTHEKQYKLLQLFAYGTLKDYSDSPDSYPPLSPAHQAKLKHLTLASLAMQSRSLPYAQLSEALQVSSMRELENVIIDSIYADLLIGKMYHHEQMFHVDWVTGRDVSKEGLVKAKAGLETWCKNAETLLSVLDHQIASVREQTLRDAEQAAKYSHVQDQAFLAAKEAMQKRASRSDKGYGGASYVNESDDSDDVGIGGSLGGMGGMSAGRMSSQRSMDSIAEMSSQRAKKRVKD